VREARVLALKPFKTVLPHENVGSRTPCLGYIDAKLIVRNVMRGLLFLITLLMSITASMAAETLSAPAALEKVKASELVLVDVRRPSEWRSSGIASVAIPLSMHEEGFLEGLADIRAANAGKSIALICATGGRTAYLQMELAKRGLGDVIDISEGMFGNGKAVGWIKRGLPLKAYP